MSIEKELNKLGWTYNKDLKTWENVDTRCVEVDDDFDSVYLDIFCYNNGEYKITFLTLEEMTLFSQLFKMSNVNFNEMSHDDLEFFRNNYIEILILHNIFFVFLV